MKNSFNGDVSHKNLAHRRIFWLILAALAFVMAIGFPVTGYGIILKFQAILFNQVMRDNDAISHGFELYLKESRKNYDSEEAWLNEIQSVADSFHMPGQGFICLIDSNSNFQVYPGYDRDQPPMSARQLTLITKNKTGSNRLNVSDLFENQKTSKTSGRFLAPSGSQLVDFRRVEIEGKSWLIGVHQMESVVENHLNEVISYIITLGLVLFLAIVLPFAIFTLVLIQRHEKERNSYIARIEQHTKEIEQVAGKLQATNQQLNRLQEEKNRLYARLSHDLRAPLSSILGSCDLVQEEIYGPATDKQKKAMQLVERNVNVLLKLINGILQLSQLESGQLKYEPATFHLNEMLQDLTENMRPNAEQKGLELRLKLDETIQEITTDRNKLYLILQNLISNAIKFTEQGFVEIAVESQENNTLVLVVRDTGPGINPEDQEKIFSEFIRGEKDKKSETGIGLGLAITQELTTLLGGTIELKSEEGEGSAFIVHLPYKSPESSTSD